MHVCLRGGPLVKVGSSAKFGVAVFKASILYSQGGPLAKVGSSAKLGVPVFKASLLDYPGGPSAKVCSSAKLLDYLVGVNLKVTGSGSNLEGDSGSKLESVLLLATRCHIMNTVCKNIP